MNYNDAPLTGQQPGQRVHTIQLQVDALPDGKLRVSTPMARGWAHTASTARELATAVHRAFLEVSCAGYARAHGQSYDLDALTTQVRGDPLAQAAPRRVRTNTVRVKVYNPELWTRLEDGRWRSPSGRAYRADSTTVRNVVRRRQERGLDD